jgi:hypothetical protein
MKCLRYGVTVWNFGYLPHTPPGRLCSWRRSPIKPLCRGRTIFPVRSREPRNPKTVKRWGVQFIFVAATGFAAAVRCVSSSRRWAASQPVVINFISTCPSPARCSEFGPPIARYFDLTHCRSIASGNLGEWPGGRRCPDDTHRASQTSGLEEPVGMAASTMPAISGKIGARYWEVPTSGTNKIPHPQRTDLWHHSVFWPKFVVWSVLCRT